MALVAAAAVLLAAALDVTVAEFPERVHPVAIFGRCVEPIDRTWRRPRVVGTLAAIVLPVAAAGVMGVLVLAASGLGPTAATVVATLVLFSTTSLRLLLERAGDVVAATTIDVEHARDAVPALVGRNPADLSPAELRSAALESAAENLVDGLVAPLLAFAVGAQVGALMGGGCATGWSLAVAAGAATCVKAVNTMDSMLGYASKPVGWASARLDDAVMWLPARVGAGLLGVAALDLRALADARAWADAPASPNSGWPMAVLASVLHVRLAKPGGYVLNPEASLPTVGEARRGLRIVAVAGGLAVVVAVAVTVVGPGSAGAMTDRVAGTSGMVVRPWS